MPLIIGFLFGSLITGTLLFSNSQNIYRVLRNKTKVLNQIISYVNHFYFDSVDMEKLMDGAFHGLMEELDPHSMYIPAKDQEDIDELFKGNFRALGSNLIY